MHSSARHLFLIIGSVLTIFGTLLFSFMNEVKSLKITGAILFAIGTVLIMRGIKNPQKRKNRTPDIRSKYKSRKDKDQNSISNEVH